MNAIPLPTAPMYQQGLTPAPHRRRYLHGVSAPLIPLYQLGYLGDAVAAATKGASMAVSTATTAAATPIATALSLPVAAVPIIGAGIVAVLAIFTAIWGAHQARVKGAKTENAAVESALQSFDQGLKAIFDAANSSDPQKNISGAQAAQFCEQLYADFWANVVPFTSGPGRADTSHGGANCGGPTNFAAPCAGMPGGHKCDKSCTASCCVGCQDIKPTIDQAIALFQSGRAGSIQVCAVGGSSYGVSARGSYSLAWTAPQLSAVSGLETLFTGGTPGGSSSWVPMALALALAWAVFA